MPYERLSKHIFGGQIQQFHPSIMIDRRRASFLVLSGHEIGNSALYIC